MLDNPTNKINHLPTKEEFHTLMDQNALDYKIFQESEPLLTHQILNHDDRINNLEQHFTNK